MNKTKFLALLLIILISLVFIPLPTAYAASNPALGNAAGFAILSSTYTNTVGGTTITGDLGYTTGPAWNPTVNGTSYSPPASKYTDAGTDQGSALGTLNANGCTYTFAAGAVDLATDTGHGAIGVYTPGVYCTAASSAASIGTAGITLSGTGTFIFKIKGALTTVANSTVKLASDASSCDVFWAPTGATTLGANSAFVGTDIDASGITIGSTVNWAGRALAFGGTVSTATDTISTACTTTSPTATPSATSSNENTFNKDTRCVATTPLVPQWASRSSANGGVNLLWSATGGNQVDIEITNDKGEYVYKYVKVPNTGHMFLPNVTLSQLIRIRVFNECEYGDWLIASNNAPSLPNTGFAPHNNNIPWYIPASLSLIQKLISLMY